MNKVNNKNVEGKPIITKEPQQPILENQSAKSLGMEGDDFFTKAPTTQAPTTQAPTTQAPTTQAPTTQAPTTGSADPTTQAPTTGSTDPMGKLNESIQQLINVIAVDTSGINMKPRSGTSADIAETVDAFAPYLSAEMDNPDSEKTLKEDVIVSSEEQKESLVSHGIFDFVSPDMWRGKDNTFNSDRVLRENLKFQAPLLVGYTNDSGLPWNSARPSQFQVGRPVKRRWDLANDRMYESKTQAPNREQQEDYIQLQSQEDFYDNLNFNPDQFKGGFNSFNNGIRIR